MGLRDDILSKEMDRKGFLKSIAAMIVMLAGGGALIKAIKTTGAEKKSSPLQRTADNSASQAPQKPIVQSSSPAPAGLLAAAAADGRDVMFWPSNPTPAIPNVTDGKPLEIGLKFTVSTATKVRGVRFYKSPQNTGTHTATLWTSAGAKLGQITFSGESASGWQEARFTTPITISAGKTYVVSYFCSKGMYPADRNYFSSPTTSGILTAPSGVNGVYKYGSRSVFPTSTYLLSNFWVDVIVENPSVADTTPPQPPVITSSASTSSVTPTITGTAEADSTVRLTLHQKVYTTTASAGAWSVTIPSADALTAGQTYDVSVTATDAAGNTSAPTAQRLSVSLPPPPPDTTGWVTRQGTQLYLGNALWRGAGANCHWLGLRESNQQYPSHSMIDEVLDGAVAMGVTVIRSHTLGISAGLQQQLVTAINADGSLVWNQAAWEPIDYAVAACRQRGIRLMVPFTDQYNYYHKGKQWWVEQAFIRQSSSGIPSTYTYDGKTETGVHSFDAASGSVGDTARYTIISQQFYRNQWIRNAWINNYVVQWFQHVNQYTGVANKSEPMIAFAQAGNELWDSGDEWPNHAGADGIAWHAQFSAAVKAVAPRVLIVDPKGNGDILHGPGAHDQNTDIMDYHLYGTSQTYASGFVTGQADKAVSLGKAMVFAEYPIVQPAVDVALGEIERHPAAAFGQFWAIYIQSENHGGSFGEDTAYVIGQNETWRSRFATHAAVMTGTTPPPPPPPPPVPDPTGPANLLRSRAAANCDGPTSLYAAGTTDSTTPVLSIEGATGVGGGSALRVNTTGTGYTWVFVNDKAAFAPVTPGATYTASVHVQLASGTLSEGAYGHISWFDANGNWLSGNDSPMPSVLTSGGSYAQTTCTAKAPANAAYASAQVGFGAQTSGSTVVRTDQYGIFAGASASPWTAPV